MSEGGDSMPFKEGYFFYWVGGLMPKGLTMLANAHVFVCLFVWPVSSELSDYGSGTRSQTYVPGILEGPPDKR